MNSELLSFFNAHYKPGRICLIGDTDVIGWLVRKGQSGLTPDGNPSLWSHSVLMGYRREDNRTDGSVYIFESDLEVSIEDWQIVNGIQENRIAKWCRSTVEHGCVLGMDLNPDQEKAVVTRALELAYDDAHLRYPIGELFGTLWAIIFRRLSKKNIFDDKYAVQCATFVRMCYQYINWDILTGPVDLTNTSPEAIYQSDVFSFRNEWHKS